MIGVLVEMTGVDPSDPKAVEIGHDIALHVASAAPRWITRDEVPADVIEAEKAVLENLTRNEGKPEQAIPKIVEGYKHIQQERGMIGVLVELAGVDPSDPKAVEVGHDIALHIASAAPRWVSRDDVPADVIEAERTVLEHLTRNEGKPEQALAKIVEGKLGGWFKRVGSKTLPGGALLEQPWVHDEKLTVEKALGDAKVVSYAQVVIGA